MHGSRLVIDWHNFGWSILSLKLGAGHVLCRVARAYEDAFAHAADLHLAVTNMMATRLGEIGVRAPVIVLHDRPAGQFSIVPASSRPQILLALQEQYHFTLKHAESRIMVTATSWTPDEDIGMLLDGLALYDALSSTALPCVTVFITGKGPLKPAFEARIAKLAMARVQVITLWLEAADYPRLVGCADLGVSFHYSSSGIDLPMKILDMFGCGVPVASIKFPA